jgi:GDP-L-fucose synthase
MNVLVLGGTGLLGYNLRNTINEIESASSWFFVGKSDADLTNYESCKKIFTTYLPTHVINLAAYVGGLYKNMQEPVEFFEKNILINIHVMKCCLEFNVIKLVSILSTCIFPDEVDYPISEVDLHRGPPHPSNEGYSYAKRMVDVLSRAYNTEYNTKFVTIIPGNLYGKNDNFSIKHGHVIPALIHKCYLSKLDKVPFVVYGTGKPLRQFTYASDLSKMIYWVLENYEENSPLIISTSEECSIRRVAHMIAEMMDFSGPVLFETSKGDGQYKKTVDSSKLNQYYPGVEFTRLQEGLNETCKWFSDNYTFIRK